MMRLDYLGYIFVMALTTYLVRMLPLALFRRKITSRFAKSFFYYIPYAVLAAMTIPAIFYSTASILASSAGLLVAIVLAYFNKPLILVALAACLTSFGVSLVPL